MPREISRGKRGLMNPNLKRQRIIITLEKRHLNESEHSHRNGNSVIRTCFERDIDPLRTKGAFIIKYHTLYYCPKTVLTINPSTRPSNDMLHIFYLLNFNISFSFM